MIANIGSIWPRSGNAFAFRRRPYWSRLAAELTKVVATSQWISDKIADFTMMSENIHPFDLDCKGCACRGCDNYHPYPITHFTCH